MTHRFTYIAYGADGRLVRGTIDQTDRKAAISHISKAGLRAIEVRPVQSRNLRRRTAPRLQTFRRTDWAKVFDQLSILLDAGFNLKEALDVACGSASDRRQTALLVTVREALAKGQVLSDILRLAERLPEHYAGLVAAGEESGKLAEIVARIVAFEVERARRRRALLDALSYPAFLMAMTLAAVVFLAFVLAPALQPLFETEAAATPVAIAMLSGLRTFLTDHWTEVLAVPLLALLLGFLARGRPGWQTMAGRVMLKIPLVGALVAELDMARYAKTLAMLVGSGVPIAEALRQSARSCSNRALGDALASAAGLVEEGFSLRSALARSGRFAPSDLALIGTGEDANRLPAMLLKVSDLTDARTARRTARFSAIAGPSITLLLGALVGVVILSVMSALLSLNDLALR